MANFFEKIFGKFKKNDDPNGTKPLPSPVGKEEDATKPLEPEPNVIMTQQMSEGGLETPQLISACAQSVGKQRDHNEDAFVADDNCPCARDVAARLQVVRARDLSLVAVPV